jgi:integrase
MLRRRFNDLNCSVKDHYATNDVVQYGGKPMKSSNLKLLRSTVMRTVARGRMPNKAYRTREHLTESEIGRLLAALKANRYGHRDWLLGLIIYRHGLRVSEACDLRWDDLDLPKRTVAVRRHHANFRECRF